MSNPAKIQKITPENQPQFPCWLWVPLIPEWKRCAKDSLVDILKIATHWHPDQPEAPKEVPMTEEEFVHQNNSSGYIRPADLPAPADSEGKALEELDLEVGETTSGKIVFVMHSGSVGAQRIIVKRAQAERVMENLRRVLHLPTAHPTTDEAIARVAAEEITRARLERQGMAVSFEEARDFNKATILRALQRARPPTSPEGDGVRITELVAEKQMIAARMQHDVSKYGELQCDYDQPIKAIEQELAEIRAASAPTSPEQEREDKERIDLIQTMIRECPHAKFNFSDDDANEQPLGFSLEINGCDPLLLDAPTFRELIDKLARSSQQQGART